MQYSDLCGENIGVVSAMTTYYPTRPRLNTTVETREFGSLGLTDP